METIRAVKGMNDVMGQEMASWRMVEEKARDICGRYGYQEIRTPLVEELALFSRGVGEGTDIVEKEMYVLSDRDGKELCLRPENTAGVVRAMVEHRSLTQETETKVFYIGNMYRRERPQKGRLRQFAQLGVEVFGLDAPSVDVEGITLLVDYLEALGLKGLRVIINTLGEPAEREGYVEALKSYFAKHEDALCEDCKRRLYKNTLRILDCKKPSCQLLIMQAPLLSDFLSEASMQHFEAVCKGLTDMGVAFERAPRLVRGLDYYTRTVFEVIATTGLGAQNAVGGGGRYDYLVQKLGGPATPAFGWAAGLERILILLEEAGLQELPLGPDVVLVSADSVGKEMIFALARDLRRLGLSVELDHASRSVKSQMRRADRLLAKAVLVLGEREITEGKGQLKLLADKNQLETELTASSIAHVLRTK